MNTHENATQLKMENKYAIEWAFLPYSYRCVLLSLSFFLVAFGQPAWNWWGGLVTAMLGYALFWRAALCWERRFHRFILGIIWYTGIQLVQLSWMVAHPYSAVFVVFVFLALGTGIQFGIICLFVNRRTLSRPSCIVAVASMWTLMEWARLFFLSGFTWNPAGLSLTGSIYSLQMASLWGVYGLTFWVILVNLLALRASVAYRWKKSLFIWVICAAIPYAYGMFHFHIHERLMQQGIHHPDAKLRTLLVQPAFPIEEEMVFRDTQDVLHFVIGEWKQILHILKTEVGESIDLIAFPEYVVPYGTYFLVFPYEVVETTFRQMFGEDGVKALPPFEEPLAGFVETVYGPMAMVSNAYWVQAVANLFHSDVVVGLEDVAHSPTMERSVFNAAFYFRPVSKEQERYEKRVLIPMGEYLPFAFCKDLAEQYGVASSFSPGTEAKVFQGKVPFGVAICYEETFGDLTRENRMMGAQLLVNLTSDVWYPNSRLPQQHFDHARLRTVESGVPLVRACNTGLTGAVDSLGRVVKTLGDDRYSSEWLSAALLVDVPLYHYRTLYSRVGDGLIIGFCAMMLLFSFSFRDLKV